MGIARLRARDIDERAVNVIGPRVAVSHDMTCRRVLLSLFVTLTACSGAPTPVDEPPDSGLDVEARPPAVPAPPPEEKSDGGSDAGLDGASDASDASGISFCDFRTATCGRTQASCIKERSCFASMRAGAGAAIEGCVLARMKCNQVDDCLEEEAQKHAAGAAAKSFANACLSAHGSCAGGIGVSDDDCANLAVFPDATLVALEACVKKPCGEISACVGTELGKLGCD